MTHLSRRLAILESAFRTNPVGSVSDFCGRWPIPPADRPPMFAGLSVPDLGLGIDASQLYLAGRQEEFTDEMRSVWTWMMDELKKNGHSLAKVPQPVGQRGLCS